MYAIFLKGGYDVVFRSHTPDTPRSAQVMNNLGRGQKTPAVLSLTNLLFYVFLMGLFSN